MQATAFQHLMFDFIDSDTDFSDSEEPVFVKRKFSPIKRQRMDSSFESSGEGIEVTVVQLLPDFDGSLDDLIFDEPVSYTNEEMSGLETEVKLEERIGGSLLHEEPSLASAGFMPPGVLQKIVDSVKDERGDNLDPEKSRKAFHPVLLERAASARSVNRFSACF